LEFKELEVLLLTYLGIKYYIGQYSSYFVSYFERNLMKGFWREQRGDAETKDAETSSA
jgi:hypothetical protein